LRRSRRSTGGAKATGERPLRPRRRFGQHFLEPAWVDKVVRVIDPKADETFIEIGPGRGALTRPLAARATAVLAYEIDRDLAAALRSTAPSNVSVIEGDFLDAEPPLGRPMRVAGNLPYNVGAPILFKLVAWYRLGQPLVDATLMLQREVSDRLTASPGTREYGVLTVLVGRHASVERLLNLPPGAFRPVPKIQSAVVRLRFHAPDPAADDENLLEEVVKAAFTRRRKTLANALAAFVSAPLSASEALSRAAIDAARRPETLSSSEWVRLANVYRSA
jgi:16S rRNA (adenine1518-N6/adenine1519-N6)-dimethyltransferase